MFYVVLWQIFSWVRLLHGTTVLRYICPLLLYLGYYCLLNYHFPLPILVFGKEVSVILIHKVMAQTHSLCIRRFLVE